MNRGNVYSVSSVNQYIKNMFLREYALSVVFVKGEISNCKYHSSGHIYFSIKDENSQLTCVMFRGDRGGLDFTMENGQEVIVGGSISVYERDGKYQLYARKIVLAGDGMLSERYEQLKKRLQEAGYFDNEHKLPLPVYVKKVGIVTAKTGAAIHDMINIAGRRNPYVQLILYPAKVQGDGAAETIAKGLETLDQMGVDVIIAGRGGGSMEDLWAFNEPVVAEAIYHCKTPVISAVGHETDFTIADFVADRRAATPSEAAELAVYDVRLLMKDLSDRKNRLLRILFQHMETVEERLDDMADRLRILNPSNQLMQKRQHLIDMEERLSLYMDQSIREAKHTVSLMAGRLDAVSPLRRLQSGYAYVADQEGKRIDSVNHVKESDKITLTMSDGRIEAQTLAVYSNEQSLF